VAAMGELGPEEIDNRLNRGDAVAIACAAGEPAGYEWLSLSSGIVELAFGIMWIVRLTRRCGTAISYFRIGAGAGYRVS
jgi:hypothetical protein